MNRVIAVSFAALSAFGIAVGCLPSGGTTGAPSTDDLGTDDTNTADGGKKKTKKVAAPACDLGESRAISQSCCEDLGADACGAGLFCAAFDGRKQSTCYAERSRADQEECGSDEQCTSGACNTKEKACQSTPGKSCTPDIGCAKTDGTGYMCVDSKCVEGSACAGNTLFANEANPACANAINTYCCPQATACSASSACTAMLKCVAPCKDQGCFDACGYTKDTPLAAILTCGNALSECSN